MLIGKKVFLSTVELTDKARDTLRSISADEFETIETTDQMPTGQVAERVEVLLLSESTWLSKSKLESMPKLRFIQTMSAGVDAFNFQIIPSNVVVCGNVGAYSGPVAEHVLALMLALSKDIIGRNEELRKGIFDQNRNGIFLRGKTIGIVGAGAIGSAVARLAKSLEMKTLGINSTGRAVGFFDEMFKIDSLDIVLAGSDVLVLALPLTIKTIDLINKSNIGRLKEDSILINVGRGRVVNENALFEHLSKHHSFKAGIDVWWRYPTSKGEPFPEHLPFLDLPNFIGSPHVADVVPEFFELGLESAIQNIVRYMKREPLKGIANRDDYIGIAH